MERIYTEDSEASRSQLPYELNIKKISKSIYMLLTVHVLFILFLQIVH